MFGRKARRAQIHTQPAQPAQRAAIDPRAIERIASRKPSFFRRVKNWTIAGAVGGALVASQGPAIRQHYNATGQNMQQGAQQALTVQQPTTQRVKNWFNGNKNQPKVVVGQKWASGRRPDGTVDIGRVDVGINAAKTFRPRVQAGGGTASAAGRGAVGGALVGAGIGAAGYARRKKKYNRDLRRELNQQRP